MSENNEIRFKVIKKIGENTNSTDDNQVRFKVIQKSYKAENEKNIRNALDPRNASANLLKNYNKAVDSLTRIPSVNYNEDFAKEYNAKKNAANMNVSQEALSSAKAIMNKARERYKNAQDYSLLEKGMNLIGGLNTESYDKAETRENYENAQSNYYNLVAASLRGQTVQPKSNLSKKLNFKAKDVEDVIAWLHNGKKELFVDENSGLVRSKKSDAYYYIDNDEKNILTHIYNSYGSKEAEEYLNFLMPQLNKRMTDNSATTGAKLANEHSIMSNAIAHITNLGKGAALGEDAINALTGKPIDVNSAAHQASIFTNAIRQQTTTNIIEETKDIPILKEINDLTSYIGIDNIAVFIYQAGVSTVDSAITFAFAKGLGSSTGITNIELDKLTSNISGVIMGSQAAQDSIIEEKQSGKSDGEAVLRGVTTGLIEGLTEKYSIDNILDNPNAILSKWIKNPGKRAFIAEGSEEWASNHLNRIADAFYYGDESEIKKSYDRYVSEGKTKDKALSLVIYDMFKEDTSSFLAGGLSGLGMYGANAVWTNMTGVNPAKVGKVIAENESENEIIGAALSLNENTEAYKLAQKISESGNMTVFDIGKLAIAINQDANMQKNKIISNAVYDEVISLGGNSREASTVSDYFVRAFNNEVSGSEALKIFKNDYVKQISNQLMQKEGGWYNKVREQLVSISNIKDRISKITSPSSIKNSKLQSSAKGVTSIIENDGKRHHVTAAEQQEITDIGRIFGKTVVFENMYEHMKSQGIDVTKGEIPDGYIDDEGVIHIGYVVSNPVAFIFKHELTHFLEKNAEKYDEFSKSVMGSQAFINWIRKKGYNSLSEYNSSIIKTYSKNISNFNENDANMEIIANFVADNLFGNSKQINAKLLNSMNQKQRRSFFELIRDFFAYLKEKLWDNKALLSEIEILEKEFIEAYKAAEKVAQKNTAESGERYMMPTESMIDLSSNNTLSKQIGDLRGALKYKIIQNYILNVLGNHSVVLNDGKEAVVDRSDALHIANKSVDKKIAEISQIKALVENAILYAEDKNVEHNKFDYFCYYKIKVKYGEEVFPIYLNVGRSKNDKIYHIYDITSKIRDTAHRINGVERPKPNEGYALQTISLNNSITDKQSTVNNNSMQQSDNNSKESKNKYLFAKTLDQELIALAEQREREQKTPQEIWRELGVVRDAAGVWVDEIDDSVMKFTPELGFPYFGDPDYEELKSLEEIEDWTDEQAERYAILDDRILEKYGYDIKLKTVLKHKELFKRYPKLAETRIVFTDMPNSETAEYVEEFNLINIDNKLLHEDRKKMEISLIHEIQHAIQYLDERENGSNVEFWAVRALIEGLPLNAKGEVAKSPEEAYWNTAGEIEARESAARIDLDVKNRREYYFPALEWDKAILANKIKEEFFEKILTHAKYSIPSNSEYISAIKSADTKTAQDMVDKAAKAVGYTERLYHQTGADFTVFNTENQKAGKYDSDLPTGIFLKPTDEDIKLKGKKQMELYALIKKPLRFENRSDAKRFWNANVPGYAEANQTIEKIDDEYARKYQNAEKATRRFMLNWKNSNPNASKSDIYNDAEFRRLYDFQQEVLEQWEANTNEASLKAKNLINAFITKGDYDGIVVENDQGSDDRSTKTYIVFSSNQLKDAAPITYDDKGNIIPLNERFNIQKEDIRYTIPTQTDEEFGIIAYDTATLYGKYEKGELSDAEFASRLKDIVDRQSVVYRNLRKNMEDMEEQHSSQLIENYRYMAKQKSRIMQQNGKLMERRSEISKRITEQREERASKQKNIEHIRKVVSRIDKMLRTNSDTKHIPEDFKGAAKHFVKIFLENDTSPFEKKDLQNIRAVYFDLLGENPIDEAEEISGFDPEVFNNLKILSNRISGKTLRELDYYDTLLIRDIVDNFSHIIKEQNEMFLNNKNQKITEVGDTALREIGSEQTKRENKIIKAIDKSIKFSNMTPIYFFERMGPTFKSLFNDVLLAQNEWYRNVENSKTFIRQIKEKYNYSKWSDDTLKMTTKYGDKIEISREQAMLLYATAKREYGNKVQRSEHLFKGGIVIEYSDKALKNAIKGLRNGENNDKAIKAFTQEIDSKAHQITPGDVAEVFGWLTEEQKEYADSMVEYLSTDMAALGNEVSMQLFGINKFNENYYIPYNSAKNFLYSQPGITNETRLKHQSFTKNTTVKANTPLVLSSFSEVCADHINRMCMYNAFTIPLENMNKIFNYKTSPTEGIASKSIRSEIERVHGAEATRYIKQFIEDMNGNVRISDEDKFINQWIGKFKKGAVFASASVVIQQPSAIMRAMALVDSKYFRKTTLKLSERDFQQAAKYAPVAGIKEMGRFDTGTGVATTQWLLYQNPEKLMDKAKALFDTKDSTYRDDKFSYLAAKADEITWAHIWAAVKAEIADNSDLRVGSKEYFERCGERFAEVINYTQVYDSTISRSQIMRSKSTGAQMLTAFMSEPTVSLNLLMKAVHEGKKGTIEGKTFAIRAIGAFVGNVILNAMLKSLITAGRDDEEEKAYLEKYAEAVSGNIISDINPLALIPFVKDILSVFEGYTVERADMSLFGDLAQSVNVLQNENKTTYQKIESISGSLAAFLGLPVKNVLRDMRTIYNICVDVFRNDKKADGTGIKYSILEGLGFDYGKEDKYEELIKAAENDDEEKYQKLYKHLIDSGEETSDIWNGIKGAYKESEEVNKETEDIMSELEGNKTFEFFSDEDKDRLETNIKGKLATEKAVNSIVKKPNKFDELYEAYRNNKYKYKKLKKELTDEGLTEKQISDGMDIARIDYMRDSGVDIKEYMLFKMATSKKYADTDNSGGVTKKEKNKVVSEMHIDNKAKNYFLNQHK